jgi:REP element-mobilizing transposase RayT
MGRRVRIEYSGMTYHVFSRGNRRAAVFRSPAEYQDFIADLERLTKIHGVQVLAFCLMPNHPHLCLRTGEDGDPLSVLMQRLNLRHARRFNRLHSVRGHLNECRYRAQVVDTGRYLLSLVRYIHQNPVRARMVERAEDWPYSSALAYAGRAWPFVLTAEVVKLAGGSEAFARMMTEKQPKKERDLFAATKAGLPALLGDLALLRWRPMHRGPWTRNPPREAIESEAEETARRAGWNLDCLAGREARRELQQARRTVAVELRARGYRLHQIARVLGRQEAAISRLLQRAEGCAESEARYGLPPRRALRSGPPPGRRARRPACAASTGRSL